MFKRKSSIKRLFFTNGGIVLVIAFVWLAAFIPLYSSQRGPVMKGDTHGDNIALQIAVDEKSDIKAYLDALDAFGVKATFFFSEQYYINDRDNVNSVLARGNGAGYISDGEERSPVMYIGSGYSIPVMNYLKGSEAMQVCPSLDVSKLKRRDDWQEVFSASLTGDMFVYIAGDNNLEDFKKTVQIVLNKGYTILKIDEMV